MIDPIPEKPWTKERIIGTALSGILAASIIANPLLDINSATIDEVMILYFISNSGLVCASIVDFFMLVFAMYPIFRPLLTKIGPEISHIVSLITFGLYAGLSIARASIHISVCSIVPGIISTSISWLSFHLGVSFLAYWLTVLNKSLLREPQRQPVDAPMT